MIIDRGQAEKSRKGAKKETTIRSLRLCERYISAETVSGAGLLTVWDSLGAGKVGLFRFQQSLKVVRRPC